MKRLAIIGSNDLAKLITHHAIFDGGYRIFGFFDNRKETGTKIDGFGRVLGNIGSVDSFFKKKLFDELIIGVGYNQPDFRQYVFNRFRSNIPMAKIIHSSSYIDPSCKIGQGVVVLPGCIIDMGVELEDNVLLNTSVSISHHSKVKAHSFIAPHVSIAGYVTIGAMCFIGIGSTIINNVELCDQVTLGASSLVLRDIVDSGTYYGQPVKRKTTSN